MEFQWNFNGYQSANWDVIQIHFVDNFNGNFMGLVFIQQIDFVLHGIGGKRLMIFVFNSI